MLAALAVALAGVGCSGSGEDAAAPTNRPVSTARTTTAAAPTTRASTTTAVPTTVPATTAAPPPEAATTPPATPAPTAAPAPAAPPPAPGGPIALIDAATAARMTASWREGCPVPLADLRLLTIPFWGFDGAPHTGELVVHADVAEGVVSVFRTLYDARFPIQRIELVDVYGGDDDRSTMANNTSAFNCRPVTGGSRWSQHAYGRAIDVNPVQNPYVYRDGHVLDPAAARLTDRSLQEPGMIHDGDVVVRAFANIGWGWGGYFTNTKDYQHFSATGG